MKPFKFFRGQRYIISTAGLEVPADTPIGLLNGYVEANLTWNELVPYRVIKRGIIFESKLAHMTPYEFAGLRIRNNENVTLCALLLEELYIPYGRIYEVWNGAGDMLRVPPREFLVNPNRKFWIEYIKTTRDEHL